ncbi:hypothetical protein [Catenuloplanes japonicus]|uniref:hypothetical protein n=1 Tax=Catenuloplanes japonicus TaxID=33876 RepID=UPI000526F932|nr:hypothetical protein [Catenuloplanes japonicus]
MLLSNIRGALRQIRQEPEEGYVGRHRAPEDDSDEAQTTILPPITAPIIPGSLPVPSPRPAPAT